MTFLATCPCKSVTCTAEWTKSLWAFDPYSDHETTHSQGRNARLFCQQFIYKVTVNQPCYQLCLDYCILVLQKWVLSYSTVIWISFSILFLPELIMLLLASGSQ